MTRLILATVALTAVPATAAEVRDHIYLVRTVQQSGMKVDLTGFKVKGGDGLYTALHGVAGARKVAVVPPDGKSLPITMRLAEADVARDIAYLLPAPGQKPLAGGGLALGRPRRLTGLAGKPAVVVGFPIGLNVFASDTKLQARSPAVKPLTTLVNESTRTFLKGRNSPSPLAEVLSLQGHLLPGHSGAPVFDADLSVVAVGAGGLDRGRVGHGWAIPFHDIRLTAVTEPAVKREIERLAKTDIDSNLFCVIDDAARKRGKEARIEVRTVVKSEDGTPVVANPQRPDQAIPNILRMGLGQLKGIKDGKKVDTEGFAKKVFGMQVWLASGTKVRILKVAGAAAKGGMPNPFMGALPFIPGKGPRKGPRPDPLKAFGKLLGDYAQGVNVQVEVLEGPHKGKKLWVFRPAVKQEAALAVK